MLGPPTIERTTATSDGWSRGLLRARADRLRLARSQRRSPRFGAERYELVADEEVFEDAVRLLGELAPLELTVCQT